MSSVCFDFDGFTAGGGRTSVTTAGPYNIDNRFLSFDKVNILNVVCNNN